jgi:hypothetical protein
MYGQDCFTGYTKSMNQLESLNDCGCGMSDALSAEERDRVIKEGISRELKNIDFISLASGNTKQLTTAVENVTKDVCTAGAMAELKAKKVQIGLGILGIAGIGWAIGKYVR